jgi:hypothetical protein
MMFTADVITIHQPPLLAHREETLDWVRAHDLNPNLVLSVRVVGPFMRARECLVSQTGRKFIRGNDFAMRTRWVRLRRRPPRTGAV